MITASVLKEAIKLAESSHHFPYRHASVIFKGKRILGSGCNSVRMNSINRKYKNFVESLHSEQAALIGLNWSDLNGYNILNIRLNPNGNLSFAYPCPMCLQLLQYINLNWCYYTERDGSIRRQRIRNMLPILEN